jgi:hypothetical protein
LAYLRVGARDLYIPALPEVSPGAGVRSATGNGGRPGSDFKFDELSLLESEVIPRNTAFNAPMFGHGRRGLVGGPEAGGYRWQSRPSSHGNLAAGSSTVRAAPARSHHRSLPKYVRRAHVPN